MAIQILGSTAATAAILFFWGGLVYAVILKRFFARHFGHIARSETEVKLGAVALEKLLQGALMTVLYRHSVALAGSGLASGLVFGALIGTLIEGTYLLSTWVNYRVELKPVLVTAVLGWPRMLLVGLVLGAINR